MTDLWTLLRRYGFNALLVALTLEAVVVVALAGDSEAEPRSSLWFAVAAIVLLALPLFARRRYPFAAPAGVWLLAAAISFADGRLLVFNSVSLAIGLSAAVLLGNLADGRQARVGLAIAIGAAAVVVYNDPLHKPGAFVFIPFLVAIAWLAGFAIRERSRQAEASEARARLAERERDATARVAVAEERARIARELHDVLGHALSVTVLQAGAIRRRLAGTHAEEAEALAGIERTGREALAEIRLLVGAMRSEGEGAELSPQPGLARLDALLAQVRGAGLPVDLRVQGERRALPAGIDLSAYRIVQEGLTNSLRHANASRAAVGLRYGADAVEIEVSDDGRGNGSGPTGQGQGLLGVGERVKVYGGEMSAGRAPGGGFVLRARLPLAGGGR